MLTAIWEAVIGGLALVLLLGQIGWISFALSDRLLPQARRDVRWAGAGAVALWLPVALFWLTAPLGLFRWPVLVLSLFVIAHLIRRGRGEAESIGRSLAQDLRAFRETLSTEDLGWARVPIALLALVGALRFLRGSSSPALAWDSLTYHLLKAGRWVADGGLISERAPDAWGYYEYFPVTGDILTAWSMLPTRGDALVTSLGLALWILSMIGAFALARELGARSGKAVLAAATVGALPSTLVFLSSAYVDNMTLATFLLAALFLTRASRDSSSREALLAAAMLGLMLGTKTSTAPLFLLGTAWLVRIGLRTRPRPGLLGVLLCGCLMLAGAPSYLRAWADTGSPVYPFSLRVGEWVHWEGNEEMRWTSSGEALKETKELDSSLDQARFLLYERTIEGAFVNPGPAAPILLLLGMLGAASTFRHKRYRLSMLFLSACALSLVALYFSDYMAFSRTTVKITTVGRYFTPLFAIAAAFAATVRGRWVTPLLAMGVLLGTWWARPVAWQGFEVSMVLGFAFVGGLSLLAMRRVLLIRSPTEKLGSTILVAGLLLLAANLLRAHHRDLLWTWASHPKAPIFHMHRLHPIYAAAWPIWSHLDQGQGLTIAATAGWDGLGHNWYRYPLLGSRLQNEVIYVPITSDGSIIDYRNESEIRDRALLPAWLAGLHEEEVDYLVSLSPRTTMEQEWIESLPKLFHPEVEDANGFHTVYRIDRQALSGLFIPARAPSSDARPSTGGPGSS